MDVQCPKCLGPMNVTDHKRVNEYEDGDLVAYDQYLFKCLQGHYAGLKKPVDTGKEQCMKEEREYYQRKAVRERMERGFFGNIIHDVKKWIKETKAANEAKMAGNDRS